MIEVRMKDIVVEYHSEVTINIGDFQNVKPGYRVSATLEGEASKSDIEDARAKLKNLVDGWLEADVAEIKSDL